MVVALHPMEVSAIVVVGGNFSLSASAGRVSAAWLASDVSKSVVSTGAASVHVARVSVLGVGVRVVSVLDVRVLATAVARAVSAVGAVLGASLRLSDAFCCCWIGRPAGAVAVRRVRGNSYRIRPSSGGASFGQRSACYNFRHRRTRWEAHREGRCGEIRIYHS